MLASGTRFLLPAVHILKMPFKVYVFTLSSKKVFQFTLSELIYNIYERLTLSQGRVIRVYFQLLNRVRKNTGSQGLCLSIIQLC